MLSKLHEKINLIVPIQGVADNGNGTYRIDYISEPNEEQIVLVNNAISNFPLDIAKDEKLKQIDLEWINLEKTGWDTGLPQGHLGITPNDVALISGAFALAKEAANLGLPIPSLVTIENNELSFNTINEMLQLMLLYGQARSQMSTQIASKRKAVENALTIEEVEAI
jgi:hypothetical protein